MHETPRLARYAPATDGWISARPSGRSIRLEAKQTRSAVRARTAGQRGAVSPAAARGYASHGDCCAPAIRTAEGTASELMQFNYLLSATHCQRGRPTVWITSACPPPGRSV